MTDYRETSLDAFVRMKDQEGALAGAQQTLFETLRTLGPSTDREVAAATKLEINIVTARRNELVKLGWVICYDRTRCSVTGHYAHRWEAQEVRLRGMAAETVRCPTCHGGGRIAATAI